MSDSIDQQLKHMQIMAKDGCTASEILSYLALEQKIEEQLVLMERFRDAFQCNLGAITAIGAWWHDGSCELDNEALDAYIMHVIEDYLETAN